eukprot:CAMPEP_0181085906 /NCGR_PEP_ID=MMETSP1071-20121207/5470_1 /TAXON_ID=35127 /ORGANISM="Thalassiosira sp., Strain NH16" /LENGTH=122 /DNA_ID=CAMNT_0023167721 /DNA_START=225 /DNA_END=589 /DNA_ORIENTATION=-
MELKYSISKKAVSANVGMYLKRISVKAANISALGSLSDTADSDVAYGPMLFMILAVVLVLTFSFSIPLVPLIFSPSISPPCPLTSMPSLTKTERSRLKNKMQVTMGKHNKTSMKAALPKFSA